MIETLSVKRLGLVEYASTFEKMKSFTIGRDKATQDQMWLLQHYPVYTQGTSCRDLPRTLNSDIPVVKTDRGGQMTYHGPGQLIVYTMIDIKRKNIGPKRLVTTLEQAVIDFLQLHQIESTRREGAPGIYVNDRKICALGLRIKNGCCYHGLSLNLDMDLTPYLDIDPCGYAGLEMTQLTDLGVRIDYPQIENQLLDCLMAQFNWT